MTVNLNGVHSIHFVGIAGIGMSALARYFLAKGYAVTGSDQTPGDQGQALVQLGVDVAHGHHSKNGRLADLVVVTSAASENNPEIVAARERGTPVVKRAELLAEVVNAGRGIAVAGTHGKTTTSALIAHILVEAGRDPTVIIGGMSGNLGSNARVGNSDLIVAEADEYDASFLKLHPTIAVITNVEPDHLDFYGTPDEYFHAFRQFASGVEQHLIVCTDNWIPPGLFLGSGAKVQAYGLSNGEWRATDLERVGDDVRFTVRHDNQNTSYQMPFLGSHNVQNALGAIIAARSLEVDHAVIARALAGFSGTGRRFELRGEVAGVLVMDDYAHHPTEVRATLAAVRDRFHRPIRLVFQPHTFSRTRDFLNEFATSFADADHVYLLDIYAARERDDGTVHINDLVKCAQAQHSHTRHTATIPATVDTLAVDAQPGDVVVTMGAGDVHRLGPLLLDVLGRP